MMAMRIQKPLAVIVAVVLTLLLTVAKATPAFAAETDTSVQSNEQFEVVEPKYEEDTNKYVTLPDAPPKEGYAFKGWSIDGGTELHQAGESIVNNDGHKLQLQPVYEAKVAAEKEPSAIDKRIMLTLCCLVIGIGTLAVGIFLLSHGKEVGLYMVYAAALFALVAFLKCLECLPLAIDEALSAYFREFRAL